MKKIECIIYSCLFSALLFSSCGVKPSDHDEHRGHDHEEHDHEGRDHEGHDHAEASKPAHFVPGKGILLTEEGKKILGVELKAVQPAAEAVARAVRMHVFRHAGESADTYAGTRIGCAYASRILPAGEADGLKLGMPLTGQHPEQTFPGRVFAIDRQLEKLTGEVEVIVEWEDAEKILAIGDPVEALWSPEAVVENTGKMTIPESALLKTARGDFAYVVNDSFLFRTPVQVARHAGQTVLIEEGLDLGDTVAGTAVQQLYLIELEVTNGGQGCTHAH